MKLVVQTVLVQQTTNLVKSKTDVLSISHIWQMMENAIKPHILVSEKSDLTLPSNVQTINLTCAPTGNVSETKVTVEPNYHVHRVNLIDASTKLVKQMQLSVRNS